MIRTLQIGTACLFSLIVPLACSSGGSDPSEPLGTVSSAAEHVKCTDAEPHHTLISDLVLASLQENFSLTQLSVDSSGAIVGPPDMPDAVAGQLELVNTVPDAQAGVAEALEKVSGLTPYTVASVAVNPSIDGCTDLLAWTADGTALTNTLVYDVDVTDTPEKSWKTTRNEFIKVCPLLKVRGDKSTVDPAGDGSTNLPASSTVSATGVLANAWGLCPSGSKAGTYCKLRYATGVNWTGRKCTAYYGSLRCLLY